MVTENTGTLDELHCQGHHVARLAADLRDFMDELDLKVWHGLIPLALENIICQFL